MQSILYHNSSGTEAFTGPLKQREVHRAITLHPIKNHTYLYRLHYYIQVCFFFCEIGVVWIWNWFSFAFTGLWWWCWNAGPLLTENMLFSIIKGRIYCTYMVWYSIKIYIFSFDLSSLPVMRIEYHLFCKLKGLQEPIPATVQGEDNVRKVEGISVKFFFLHRY